MNIDQPTSSDPGYEATHTFSDLNEALEAVRAAVTLGFSFRLEDRWTVEEVIDPHTEHMIQSLGYELRVTEERMYSPGSEDDE